MPKPYTLMTSHVLSQGGCFCCQHSGLLCLRSWILKKKSNCYKNMFTSTFFLLNVHLKTSHLIINFLQEKTYLVSCSHSRWSVIIETITEWSILMFCCIWHHLDLSWPLGFGLCLGLCLVQVWALSDTTKHLGPVIVHILALLVYGKFTRSKTKIKKY